MMRLVAASLAGLAMAIGSGPAVGQPETAAATPVSSGAAVSSRGPVTNLPMPRYVSIRSETANARRGPGFDHRVDWEFVRRGLPVEVVAEYGHWRKVRDADGLGGWVHHTLLSGVRTGLVQGSEMVPLRADPESGASVRAMAEPGVVTRIEACEDAWCEVRAGKTEGWLPRATLWGVGPDEEFD